MSLRGAMVVVPETGERFMIKRPQPQRWSFWDWYFGNEQP